MMGITDNMPPEVRKYREALDQWNLAAARWLGLNPEAVTRLDVDKDERGHTVGKWEAVDQQKPRLGYVETGAHGTSGGGEWEFVAYTGSVTLDYLDAEAFYDAVGPKPEMFTPAERVQLDALMWRSQQEPRL